MPDREKQTEGSAGSRGSAPNHGSKNETLILAHDLGTSGNKATLYDRSGNLLASSFSGYPTSFPRPGWAEQDPEQWWRAVVESTGALLEAVPDAVRRIGGISFSGHMMSCTPVDREGKALHRAIIWSDQRAFRQKERLGEVFGNRETYERTGTVFVANYLAAKALWLKQNEPGVFKKTFCYLQPKDFVAHRLTGSMVTDYSDASGTNLFDLRKKQWCADIAGEIGLSVDALPRAIPSTQRAGVLTKQAASCLGLQQGLPVIIGGGDGVCATAGAGSSAPGSCYNSYGTSAWNAVTGAQPLYDAGQRNFILCHLDENLYMAAGTMQNAGGSFEWLNEWIGCLERSVSSQLDITAYELLSLEAQKAPPGSCGVLFLPYLMGERSPYWDPEVRGAFLGLCRSTGRNEIIRAVLEGTVFHLKLILDMFIENGTRVSGVRLIGGGARSPLLRRIMADIWGVPVTAMRYLEEASSLGAAIAGLVGIGLHPSVIEAEKVMVHEGERLHPDLELHRRYSESYGIFKEAYQALRGVHAKMHRAAEETGG
jgi:xylulokinase